MKIYLDNNLGVTKVEQEELTQDTIGYNILKVYIPNAVLTPYDTFTCYYGALLQNGRKVGWFAMEARTSTDADYEANYTLYKATLEQCVVSVEGKVYIGCQILLGNSGNATLIKKNTAVVQFNVRKSVAINNDILVLDTDQTTTDVLESYKQLLENALTTYATKATTYTKTQVDSALALKADKSDVTYAMKPYSSTNYSDCNSVPTNSIITILSNNSYANMPNNHTEGTLLTFNQYSNAIGSSGQTQIFVSTNNKTYTRIKWGSGGWPSWKKLTTMDDLDNIDIFPIALYGEGASQYPNLNNVPNNKILTYTTTTDVTNLPVNRVGTLFTFCAYQRTNNAGCVQIYVTDQSFLYWRIRWGNAWGEWKSAGDNVVIGYNLNSTYTNLNNVPNGYVITYTAPLTNYTNLPDNIEGTLYTFGAYQRSNTLGQAQLYVGSNNVIYSRIKWGNGWTNWKTIKSLNSSYTDVRYDDYIYSKYDFNNKSVLWCGDSIIRGETIGGVVVDHPVAELFSNYFNMTYTNIAVGGARFVQTGSSSTILGQLTNNQLRNIDYLFIGAGVNDNGANVDIDDFKEAIEDVLNYIVANYNSNIKVFFITPIRNYQNSSNNDKLYIYRNAITETIIKYNDNRFNVIQGDKFDFPLYNSNATYKTLMSEDGLHPTQLGYSTAYLRGLLKALK